MATWKFWSSILLTFALASCGVSGADLTKANAYTWWLGVEDRARMDGLQQQVDEIRRGCPCARERELGEWGK